MVHLHSEEQIGEAWRLHRSGDNARAANMFRDVLAKTPKHMDALYGLGLALRADGDNAGAKEAFESALEIAQNALQAEDNISAAEGHHGSNNLNTYEDDRLLMLQRMLRQRIEEVS